MSESTASDGEFVERLRRELPRLLKEQPELRAEIAALLAGHLTTREETARLLDELGAAREASDARFEQLLREIREDVQAAERRHDALLKEMKAGFEAADRRFQEMHERFEAADRRFEAVDRRFEAVHRRFEAVDRRFEAVDRRFSDMEDWVGIVVGGFQRRAGRGLEDAIAGALRVALRERDLRADTLKLRQKVTDTEGRMGPAGRTYESDLLVSDGRTLIFEIKSAADREAVERFADKSELAMAVLGLKQAEKVLVTLDKSDEVIEACRERGVRLAG